MEEFTFGWALEQMKAGNVVTRPTWQNYKVHIGIMFAGPGTDCSGDYIYYTDHKGITYPWTFDNEDVLATDWALAKDQD